MDKGIEALNPVNTEDMIPIEHLASADIEYVDEVIELADRATEYINSMPWCEKIVERWLGDAWGYVLGVFYFRIQPSRPDIPEFIWVIMGDMPPAYEGYDCASNVIEAIEVYVDGAQEWIDRVNDGRPMDETVMPVNVPPTKEWAKRLGIRLDIIRENILNPESTAD